MLLTNTGCVCRCHCAACLQRARRQAFIRENGLLHVRRVQGNEKRRLPGEKEKHAQMRVFAR